MLRVAVRGVLARKLRFAMTTIAVALGVMLMAGSFIFTDTFSKGFDNIFSAAFEGTDVTVSAAPPVEVDDLQEQPTVPAALLDAVRGVDGVEAAEGGIFDGTGTVLDKQGKPITTGGAPTFIASTSSVAQLDPYDFPEGRAPERPGEAALDDATADRKHFEIGDRVRVQGAGGIQTMRLVGKLTLGGSGSVGGATIALTTLGQAQQLTGHEGRFDSISIVAADGVTPEALRDRIAERVGPRYDVKTGQQEEEETAEEVKEGLGILRTFLNAFAGIALFVGGFLIFNTFSITVAQRMRELALLRTLGASKRQVLGSVLMEGLIIGLAGSVIGLVLGAAIAQLLKNLLKSAGIEMPNVGLVVAPRTVIVALLVGTGITLVSALLPALRATRVPPIAALQEGAVLPASRGARAMTPVALVLLLLGALLVVLGLSADRVGPGLLRTGVGALLAFVAIGLLSPKLVVPLANVLGAPLRALGMPGRLARENAMRFPGRTAITSAALMVGVALVTLALIVTSSFKATLAEAVETNLLAQAVVQDRNNTFQAFPDQTVAELERDPAVEVASGVSQAEAAIAELQDTTDVSGVNPRAFPRLFKLEITDGPADAIRRLTPETVILQDDFAEEHGFEIGDTLNVLTPTSARIRVRVIALKHDTSDLTGNLVFSEDTLNRRFDVDRFVFAMMRYRSGVDAGPATERIKRSFERLYPRLKVQTAQEFQDDQERQIDQFLGIIFALLALSIIVAVFGIVNTLVLAITERTRELGLLRAIGMTRRQVRRMVRYESVITALIGTVLGTFIGILLGIALAQPLGDDLKLSVPVGSIIVVIILGGIVGVLAAIWPARRASRLNVLESLAYE